MHLSSLPFPIACPLENLLTSADVLLRYSWKRDYQIFIFFNASLRIGLLVARLISVFLVSFGINLCVGLRVCHENRRKLPLAQHNGISRTFLSILIF